MEGTLRGRVVEEGEEAEAQAVRGNLSEVLRGMIAPDNDSIEITWTIGDVQSQCSTLTDDEARQVLGFIERHHDATIGINWDIIDMAIQHLFPEKHKHDEDDESDEEQFECQNCGKRWAIDELLPVQDLLQRVAPGEPMPAGECPECGAVCHGEDDDDDDDDEEYDEFDLMTEEEVIERQGWTPVTMELLRQRFINEDRHVEGSFLDWIRKLAREESEGELNDAAEEAEDNG